MKYKHILEPITDGGKLLRSLRSFQYELAISKVAIDSKKVAGTLIWFDEQNSKLLKPSKKVEKLIAGIWKHYCK